MVFAAGLGSRLGEITKTTPKCLVEVGGKTILEHVITRLKNAGVTSIVINLHYLGEKIEKFIKKNNSFGIDFEFSREENLLGTGGGLKNASSYFSKEKDFIIYNSDIYCELDLAELIAAHRKQNNLATLCTMKRKSSRYLYFNASNQLENWNSAEAKDVVSSTISPELTELAFAGIHIASLKIFDFMKEDQGNFSILKSYLRASVAGSAIRSFQIDKDYWIDIGKPETLQALRERLEGKNK